MGVVYYANYLVWFEVGRTDLLRHSGWSYREMEADGFALPVIEAHCAYRRPARYDDELEIRTRGPTAVARAGASSTTRWCAPPTTALAGRRATPCTRRSTRRAGRAGCPSASATMFPRGK